MLRSLRLSLAFAAALLTASTSQALEAVLGVAELEPSGLCLVSTSATVAPGDAVSPVNPRRPQRVLAGTVGDALPDGCGFALGAGLPGAAFRVAADGITEPSPLIAVARPSGEVEVVEGSAHAELDGASPSETFRLCYSSEGLWITVWSGQPLTGRLRWQVYYYLGYDVGPNCEDADSREPEP